MRRLWLRQLHRCLAPEGWEDSVRCHPPCRVRGTGRDCQLRMARLVSLCLVLIHGVTHLHNQRHRQLRSGRLCHSSLQCPLVTLFRGIVLLSGICPQAMLCPIRHPGRQRIHRKRFMCLLCLSCLLRRPSRQCAHRKRLVHLQYATVRDPLLHPKGEGRGSLNVSVRTCSSLRSQPGLALSRRLLRIHRLQS